MTRDSSSARSPFRRAICEEIARPRNSIARGAQESRCKLQFATRLLAFYRIPRRAPLIIRHRVARRARVRLLPPREEKRKRVPARTNETRLSHVRLIWRLANASAKFTVVHKWKADSFARARARTGIYHVVFPSRGTRDPLRNPAHSFRRARYRCNLTDVIARNPRDFAGNARSANIHVPRRFDDSARFSRSWIV